MNKDSLNPYNSQVVNEEDWCAYCKKYGHNVIDCENENMYCYYCGDTGHHFSKHKDGGFLDYLTRMVDNHYRWIQNELVRYDGELEIINKNEKLIKNVIEIFSNDTNEKLKEMCLKGSEYIEMNRESKERVVKKVDEYRVMKTSYRNEMKKLKEVIDPLLNEKSKEEDEEEEIPVARCHICENSKMERSAICCGYCLCRVCYENIAVMMGSCPNCRAIPLQCSKIII